MLRKTRKFTPCENFPLYGRSDIHIPAAFAVVMGQLLTLMAGNNCFEDSGKAYKGPDSSAMVTVVYYNTGIVLKLTFVEYVSFSLAAIACFDYY